MGVPKVWILSSPLIVIPYYNGVRKVYHSVRKVCHGVRTAQVIFQAKSFTKIFDYGGQNGTLVITPQKYFSPPIRGG